MEHEINKIFKIKELAFYIDQNVFDCLLLIRQASETYIPYGSQLTMSELLNGKESSNKTPWEVVANPENFRNRDYISVIETVLFKY